MDSRSLQTREVIFAFLFGPPKLVPRDEATQIHNAVCDALKHDDLSFSYRRLDSGSQGNIQQPMVPVPPGGPSSGFSVIIERREGRGGFRVILDNQSIHQPLRLLLTHTWPSSQQQQTVDLFDMISDAVFSTLEGSWQKIMAEVRVRSQCPVAGNDSLHYILNHCLRLNADQVSALGGDPSFASLKIEVPDRQPMTDQLEHPKRELHIEILREDPSQLYLEQVSQWPQMHAPGGQAGEVTIDPSRMRTIEETPGTYVRNSLDYLIEVLGSYPRGE